MSCRTPPLGEELLARLWENRVAIIISNLKMGERQHREIANAASHMRADYHGRFLIELLQNASDQAAKADRGVSTVVVVRTRGFLALLNEGAPFDERGVRAITSLALSPKNAEESLGNKGIGFKSVFQVSDGPEIYSAARADQGLADGVSHAFRLDREPVAQPIFRDRIRQIVDRFFAEHPDTREEIATVAPDRDATALVMREIAAAPPWKFPLPRSADDVSAHARALEIEDAWLATMQTLIVLPLLADDRTQQIVDQALDEVRTLTTHLFLPHVRELIVCDRVRGRNERVHKRPLHQHPERLAHGALFREWEMALWRDGQPVGPAHRFWIVSRVMGDPGGEVEVAAAERRAIAEAASHLPGEGWSQVERATVSVALPRPDASGRMPNADGLFCIGLPTHDRTGLPLWVDAHFHGTVARTGIIFAEPYNKLLLNEAVRLVEALIERLKQAL
ncbi:sacsin N-terminal ATP-binding-like domain-containing protein [Sorangium sp. So ce1335]|uniref:sacsin N-terminal ATP-binding-like domain-containing protein n=1 Tax=Sorangium sp. So ce1335 TaxID=3133335 RepID=UPI003F5E3A12